MFLLVGLVQFFRLTSAQAAYSAGSADGDFIVAMGTDVAGLDPALDLDSTSLLVAKQIYDTLVTYQPGSSLTTPSLAESWTVSSNGLLWTINLRAGVKFQDGNALNASAVAYNLERWWDPAHPYHNGSFVYFNGLFGGFKGDPNCLIAGVATNGTSQVKISLSRPSSNLPSILALPAFSIASPAAIQAGTLSSNPVGSGPFKFIERLPGDHVSLGVNPDYWGGAPKLGTLTFKVIANTADRYAALENGSVHSVGDLHNDYAASAASDPKMQASWRPAVSIGYLGINRSRTPLDNLLVRQAIAHAINKPDLISNHYLNGTQAAGQFLPPAIWGYKPSLTDYAYDPALAISLLSQAGYSSGFTTTLSYRPVSRPYLPDPAATANAIQADLQAVGIQATVIEYDSTTFLQKVYSGELDLFLLGWSPDYPHSDNYFSPILCSSTSISVGPIDTQLCNGVQAALSMPDFNDQLAAYQTASQRVHDSLPLVPLANTRSPLIMRDVVAGLNPSLIGAEEYKSATITGAAQSMISPDTGGSLVYTNTQGQLARIIVPAEAVITTTLLRYAAMETTSAPPYFASAKHSFELSAHRNGDNLPGFLFQKPILITLGYADSQVTRLKRRA